MSGIESRLSRLNVLSRRVSSNITTMPVVLFDDNNNLFIKSKNANGDIVQAQVVRTALGLSVPSMPEVVIGPHLLVPAPMTVEEWEAEHGTSN